jgi:hypothetical protein
MTKGERIAESAVIAVIAGIGKSKALTTHSTSLQAGYGHEGTRRDSRENALHLHLRCTHPRGSSLAVACAPPALGMTEGERIAERAVIAQHRRERNVKSFNHPFDYAQGELRTRRNTKKSPRSTSSRDIAVIAEKEKQIPRSARNDNPGNILRQIGTDNSTYDRGEIFKLKFTCIFYRSEIMEESDDLVI